MTQRRTQFWEQYIVPIIHEIQKKLKSLGFTGNGQHVTTLEFTESQAKYGVDFTSDGDDSARGLLYSHRLEIQRDFGIWWDDWTGKGLRFTNHPLVGAEWRMEALDQAQTMAEKYAALLTSASHDGDTPELQRQVLALLAARAEHIAAISRVEVEGMYRLLADARARGLLPPAPVQDNAA